MHLDLESGRKTPGPSDKRQRVATISRPGERHVEHGRSHSVVREQYCACTSARRTKLEKFMMVVIVVMGFVIVALVSAIGAIAKINHEECEGGGRFGLFRNVNPARSSDQ